MTHGGFANVVSGIGDRDAIYGFESGESRSEAFDAAAELT
jgi:hypothetical protein